LRPVNQKNEHVTINPETNNRQFFREDAVRQYVEGERIASDTSNNGLNAIVVSWILFVALGAIAIILLLQMKAATSGAVIVRLKDDFAGGRTRVAILPIGYGYLLYSGEHVTVSAGNRSEPVVIYTIEREASLNEMQERFGLTESLRSEFHAPTVVGLANIRDSSLCPEDHKPCLGTIQLQARPVLRD
jgi:hypothetical protein